jgi:hypothetical protein
LLLKSEGIFFYELHFDFYEPIDYFRVQLSYESKEEKRKMHFQQEYLLTERV